MEETKNVPMVMDDVLSTSTTPQSSVENTAVGTPQRPQFVVPPKTKTIIRKYNKKIGRNDPCPCGSGLKYKKCCLKTGEYEKVRELTGMEMRQIRDHEQSPSDFKIPL